MALTKNLANCEPIEFLVQTNKIRKAAERWLEATDILAIRRNVPKLEMPDDPAKAEEALEKHREQMKEAAKRNLSAMLDSILEEHPKETLEVLALACFVEPEDVNKHKITEYLANVADILNDEAVISFFTSLMRLEQTGILSA